MTILLYWFVLLVWALTLILAARWGHKMGEAREKAGRLLFVTIGPTEIIIAGQLIRLAPGELFEARMWRRDASDLHKGEAGRTHRLAERERAARLIND